MHLLMMVEAGVPVLAGLFLETSAGLLALEEKNSAARAAHPHFHGDASVRHSGSIRLPPSRTISRHAGTRAGKARFLLAIEEAGAAGPSDCRHLRRYHSIRCLAPRRRICALLASIPPWTHRRGYSRVRARAVRRPR